MLAIEARQEAALEIDGDELIDAPQGTPEDLDVWNRTISAHLKILDDEGFIEAEFSQVLDTRGVIAAPENIQILRLTSAGHDYLDSVHSSVVWSKTKEALAKVGGGASLEVVKVVAGTVAKAMLGIPG